MKDFFARFRDNQFVPLGILLGVAFVLVGIIAAWTAVDIKNAANTLTVTGSATADVTADTATWTLTANRSGFASDLPGATAQVLSDAKDIQSFLVKAGVPASAITIGAVHTNQDYSYYKADQNAPSRYVVSQDVTVASSSPELIQKLSQDTSALTNQGLMVTTQDPQYFISDLPQYRISLAAAAMKDARARAVELVKTTHQSVGPLRAASTASVQVMAANSMNVSDYGTYDTSTIDKTVMVSVRATFGVN